MPPKHPKHTTPKPTLKPTLKPAPRGRCRTSKITLSAVKAQSRAMDLRIKGLNYRQIAAELGYSVGRVYKMVSEGIAQLQQDCAEKANEVRLIETDRLDQMLTALQGRLDTGEPQAVNAALRIMERRSRLLGLDVQEPESTLERALAALLAAPPTPEQGTDDEDDA